MRVAIPVENGYLSPHFGHCEGFYIATVENGQTVNSETVLPPEHGEGIFPTFLANNGVNVIIAGGMGPRAKDFFNQFNIDVYTGAEEKKPEALINDLINGILRTTEKSCSGGHMHNCHE
jgi:predicted Fe-Mo cluster-binding NifX family protein